MNRLHPFLAPAAHRYEQLCRRAAMVWRAHRDSRRRRRQHLVRAWVVLVGLMVSVPLAQLAFADDGAPAGSMGHLTATDSQGYEVWRYELNIDEGQMHRAQEKIPAGMLLNWGWDFYRLCVGDALKLTDVVLNFEFINWLQGPALMVEQTLSKVIDMMGLWGLLLTISAFLAGYWWFKGRAGVAIGQVLLACLIASLGQNHLTDPVGLLTGPEGALVKSQQFGQEITAQMLNDNPDAAVKVDEDGNITNSITASLVDTFVREPHQMVNYGTSFDRNGDQDCIDAYNKGLEGAPYDRDPDWRNGIKGPCGKQYWDRANDPAGSIISVAAITPAGILLTFVVLCLAIGLFLAVGWALFEAALLCLRLLQATLPGGARGSMWQSFGTMAVSVLICSVALLVLAVTVLLVDAAFAGTQGMDPFEAFILIDILLFLMLVVTFRVVMGARKKGKTLGDALNRATSPAPKAADTGTRWTGPTVASAAASTTAALRGTRSSAVAAGIGYGTARATDDDGPNPSGRPSTGAPRNRGWGHAAGRATKQTGKAVFNYTAGAPVTVTRKVAAAQTATRTYRAHKREQLDATLDKARAYQQEYAESLRTIRGWSKGSRR